MPAVENQSERCRRTFVYYAAFYSALILKNLPPKVMMSLLYNTNGVVKKRTSSV